MARKKTTVDPEIKESIDGVVMAIDALIDSDFPATVATLMFRMKKELMVAGFSQDEAMQLVIAHGATSPGPAR